MEGGKLLMIEDDVELVGVMKLHIEDLGFSCESAHDGVTGLNKALEGTYDLIVLDCMLPEMDGFEVCRRIRAVNETVPILMLTSRSDEVDKVVGLDSGADDYVTKPYQLAEFTARVRALLRRSKVASTAAGGAEGGEERRFGDLLIDTYRCKVFRGEREIALTAREYDVVAFLSEHPGRPYSREQLLRHVWDSSLSSYEHSVSLTISRLRKKLEDDHENPRYLLTVRGIGYRFVEATEFED